MTTKHQDGRTAALQQLRLVAGQWLVPLMLLGFSVWKWDLLSTSVSSLVLALLSLFLPTARDGGSIRWTDLLEYWIAGSVWVVLLIGVIAGIARRFRGNGGHAIPGRRWFNAHAAVIVCCCLLAIEAPILSPFDPLGQGDLRTTRLVAPFGAGYAVTPSRDDKSHREDGFDVPALQRTSTQKLLHGQATFTVLRDGGGNAASVPEGARTVLGTDNLGRDVLSRLLYGLRLSLIIGISSMVLSVLIGMIAGFIAGFARQAWIDQLVMRLVDLFLAIPSLFFIIAVLALFGNSTTLLVLVLAATGWMGIARMVRGEVIALRHREFILAAGMLGRKRMQIVMEHLLPNVLPVLRVSAVLQLANVVLAEASLSFLGLGIQPPAPSLGNMIGESMGFAGWWVGVFPGVILTMLLFSFNRVSDSLQHAKIGGGSHD